MTKRRPKPDISKSFQDDLRQAFRDRDETRALQSLEVYLAGGQPVLPGLDLSSIIRANNKKILRFISESLPETVSPAALQEAFSRRPDPRFFVTFLIQNGAAGLHEIGPVPFTVVEPARARRYNSGEEALEQAGEGTWLVEPKQDGWECQIHAQNGVVRIYSQAGKDLSQAAPEVVTSSQTLIGTVTAILEGELMAIDPITGQDLPHEQMQVAGTIHRAVIFDVPLWNTDQTRRACLERFSLLKQLFQERIRGVLSLTEQVRVDNRDDFLRYFQEWRQAGFEGMIAKRPNVGYEAGKRTKNRIKIKPMDTVDAVLIGYSTGNRCYLAALLDENSGEYVPFAWIYSGAGLRAEAQMELEASRLLVQMSGAKAFRVADKIADVIMSPQIIAEIGGDHIHPADYPCGLHTTGKGWTLFGAKFIRLRDDKGLNDVTTVSEFLSLPVVAGYERPKIRDID